MKREYILIAIGWIIAIGLLIRFIPKNKIREAMVAFTFMQLLTWLLGLSVAELGLIEYPVRLFAHVNKTSFTFEYFVYPAICAVFNVNFPENKNAFGRFRYYFYICTSITIIEVVVEEYTELIEYIHWTWHITWITLLITFYVTRKYYEWFFQLKKKKY
ncbi:MAG: CBO0543 family protein [Bacillota bacterium]|nr:CBO0543 family protein [Bacillota bacterium]